MPETSRFAEAPFGSSSANGFSHFGFSWFEKPVPTDDLISSKIALPEWGKAGGLADSGSFFARKAQSVKSV